MTTPRQWLEEALNEKWTETASGSNLIINKEVFEGEYLPAMQTLLRVIDTMQKVDSAADKCHALREILKEWVDAAE